MKSDLVPLGDVVRVVYGSALREPERVQSGQFDVFGSAGPVGRHDQALTTEPTVVIGRKGSVGAITYAPSGGWVIDTAFYVEPIDRKSIDLRYMFHALAGAKLARHTITTSIPGLSRDDIYRTHIRVPPLFEQRRIADMLDKADAVRRKRKEAIALTEELLRAAFLDMFGDPATNPKGWPKSTFGAELEDMEYGPRFYNEKYSDDGVRIVRITDLNAAGALDFESMPRLSMSEADRARYALRPGEIIFARTGATVGKTALVEEGAPECVAGAYFIRLKLKKRVHPRYARMVLASERVQALIARRSRQSAQQNFSGPGIRELALPVPPLPLQRQLDAIATQCAKLGSSQGGHSERANDLFEILMQRAFRGGLEHS